MVIASPDADLAARGRAARWPYLVVGVSALAAAGYLAVWGGRYGLDLRVYRNSVTLWRAGHDPYLYTLAHSRLTFTYPPFALLALWPLAWASFSVTQWLLWAASIVAATVSVVLVLRDRGYEVSRRLWCAALAWSCLSVIVLEPARSGVDYGQIELVLMLVVVADLLAVPSRYRGIATGVAAAVKLTPLVFLIVLLARRDLRSAARALATFAACTALAWILWPGLPRVYWDRVVSHPARVGRVSYGGNQSWYAIVHRPPFPATGSTAAWLLLSVATLAASCFVALRCARDDRRAAAMISVALAGLLISPISWTHHWVWVLLIPPLLAGHRGAEVPLAARAGLWGVIAVTVAGPYWWFGGGVPADVLGALLPLWAGGTLAVWAAAELADWRAGSTARRPLHEAAGRRYEGARGGGERSSRGTSQPGPG